MIAIIVLLLLTFSLGVSIAKHGEERTPHNGWMALLSYMIWVLLLYYLGVFNNLIL